MMKATKFLPLFLVFIFIFGGASESLSEQSVGEMEVTVARKGIKRAVKVYLYRKITKKQLREVALKIKNGDPTFYKRTFIDYFFEGQDNTSSWATTHFNPDLEVKILGLTIEEENKLINDLEKPPGEIVGVWLLDEAHIAEKLTIYRQNGKIMIELKYPDLSHDRKEMTTSFSEKGIGLKYKKKADIDSDTYFINEKGDLEIWDSYGLAAKARKIR